MNIVEAGYRRTLRLIGIQNWLRWSLRWRLSQFLKSVDKEFSIPFFGKVYYGNFNNLIDRQAFFFGAHGREEMMCMGTFIPRDGVVLDIGGNVGHHALYFSIKAKEVHAFEPDVHFSETFRKLMSRNGVTNVTLHDVGVGDVSKKMRYYRAVGDNNGTGSFIENHYPTNQQSDELPIVRIDDMKFRRVDFVKIDTEGYEKYVLMGMQETMRRCRPVIILEYARRAFSSEEEFRSLFPNYTPYTIESNRTFFLFFNRPKAVIAPFRFEKRRSEVVLMPM
jgi:FkbM family methyltransferase